MASPATDQHRRELGLVAGLTARGVRAEARKADVADIDSWWLSGASSRISSIVAQGFAATAALGANYLVASALAGGFQIDPVMAVMDLTQLATSLRVTGPVAFKTHMRSTGSPDASLRVMETRLGGAAQRLALAGERETVMKAIQTVDVIVGYRRVTAAGACKFCEMLAGRGAVYTKASATAVVGRAGQARGARKLGEPYHDSCRCSVEPVFDTITPPVIIEPPPSLLEPEIEPEPVVTPVVEPAPTQGVVDARRRFREEPQVPMDRFDQLDADGNRVPTPEMFAREQLRHDVGAEADGLIRQRMRDNGFLTEEEARQRATDAIKRRNETEDAWLAGSGRRGTKAHRAYLEAEQELLDAQGAMFRAREDFAKEYQAQMRALLDEMGVARGGVPARDLVTNYDQVEPGLRNRIGEALDLYPTEWLHRSTGRDRFEVIQESPRAFMRPASLTRDAQMNLAPDEQVSVIAHEFGHQVENLSYEVRRAEWALYWRRSGGDPLQQLTDVTGYGYRDDEMTRVDEWPNPYMGKPYGSASATSNYEVWTMAAEHYLPDAPSFTSSTAAKFWADEDLRQWFLGVLLTA